MGEQAREEIAERDRAPRRGVHAGDFVEDWDLDGLFARARRRSSRSSFGARGPRPPRRIDRDELDRAAHRGGAGALRRARGGARRGADARARALPAAADHRPALARAPLRHGLPARGHPPARVRPDRAARRLQERGASTLFQRPDEHDLGRLRAHDLQRRGRRSTADGEPPQQVVPVRPSRAPSWVGGGGLTYSGGVDRDRARRARARRPTPPRSASPRRPRRTTARCAIVEQRARRRRATRSGATTRAGAGRARSSRSATAPDGSPPETAPRPRLPIASGRVHRRPPHPRADAAAPGGDPRAAEAARGLSLTRLRWSERVAALEAEMGAPGFWDDPSGRRRCRPSTRARPRRLETLRGARARRRGSRRARRDGRRGRVAAGRGRGADRVGRGAARRARGAAAVLRPLRRRRRARDGQRRRRRHRRAGLGRDGAADADALGREARLRGRAAGGERGRGGRHQVGDLPRSRRERLRAVRRREGRAPAGAAVAVRLGPPPPDELRGRRGRAGRRGHRRGRDRRRRPAGRHLPRLGRRRPARQQDRLGGAHHAPADAGSSCSARTSARSPPTARPRWRCCARSCSSARSASARRRSRARRARRRTSTSARRSAPTCCTRTRWSRTTAPGVEMGDVQRVLDGDLDGFVRAYLLCRRRQRRRARTERGGPARRWSGAALRGGRRRRRRDDRGDRRAEARARAR